MTVYFTPLPSSSLRVTGADRTDFLQGQMTNDIRSCPAPGMVPACFLNVRGQIEHFARIYRRKDDLYLHLDAGEAAQLAARLRKYIIFDQVEVHDLSDQLATLHLWGDGPADLPGWPDPQAVPAGGAWEVQLDHAQVLLGAVNRTGVMGLDLHYLTAQQEEVLAWLAEHLAPQALPWEELQAQRIQAGLPEPALDAFAGLLLQEVGLDLDGPLPAISYRKGCYVGQEIMARLEARGKPRYGLAQLQVAAGTLAGSEVLAGSKVVGQTGLAAGGLALARLRLDLPADAPLEVAGQSVQRVQGVQP
ncbi:YgfZ/GcvT domain-containing protein [Deinococcus radiophilus]|uniref:Folate-binding protein n=1 Tax=Deinococcus radiophilus TaxID=32062 RepID=A0A431VVN6_9DEIO|nr:folate-binding protein YgfZ [Deinococcus radiophilus]RTR27296.1 folate-binding protein [Deinococcus radiophilus]UFA50616.1 folate-binding protein YgfZ [Deinococcus radiophilus]